MTALPSPDSLCAALAERPKLHARDLAAELGVPEAALLAAHVGHGVARIDPDPDRLVAGAAALGDVLALTRNESCVHERRGAYEGYQGGAHAAMVVGPEIDLRIFPAHWVHAFAVEEPGEQGMKRSLQVFDAAGDAVHKIHLGAGSDAAAFAALVAVLRMRDGDMPAFAPRVPPELARADPAKAADLRRGWDELTDTHQFLRFVHKLKMNRLGAYRLAGEPFARALAPDAVTQVLETCAGQRVPVMIFVGNRGCIQIHGGLIERILPMGPWINVMDPRFNLHLRADRVSEVWRVVKPTRTGPAVSVEAFAADGELILQIFGMRKDGAPEAWDRLTEALPRAAAVPA